MLGVYKEDRRGGKIIKKEGPNLTTRRKNKTSKSITKNRTRTWTPLQQHVRADPAQPQLSLSAAHALVRCGQPRVDLLHTYSAGIAVWPSARMPLPTFFPRVLVRRLRRPVL